LETTTPGGGGWGNPRKRDPELVLQDVIAGLVSVERALEVYSVAIDVNEMVIDIQKTAALRDQSK
jgi:N-methylhydantoinase B